VRALGSDIPGLAGPRDGPPNCFIHKAKCASDLEPQGRPALIISAACKCRRRRKLLNSWLCPTAATGPRSPCGPAGPCIPAAPCGPMGPTGPGALFTGNSLRSCRSNPRGPGGGRCLHHLRRYLSDAIEGRPRSNVLHARSGPYAARYKKSLLHPGARRCVTRSQAPDMSRTRSKPRYGVSVAPPISKPLS
jgi:hypothetical protein